MINEEIMKSMGRVIHVAENLPGFVFRQRLKNLFISDMKRIAQ